MSLGKAEGVRTEAVHEQTGGREDGIDSYFEDFDCKEKWMHGMVFRDVRQVRNKINCIYIYLMEGIRMRMLVRKRVENGVTSDGEETRAGAKSWSRQCDRCLLGSLPYLVQVPVPTSQPQRNVLQLLPTSPNPPSRLRGSRR